MFSNEFNDDYLNELLDKWSEEQKTIFLFGGFNLLNYDIHPLNNEFLHSRSSHDFLSHILQPIRVTNNFKTLVDNVFSKMALPIIISGNLTASMLHHLPRFLVTYNIFFNCSYPKSNKNERDKVLLSIVFRSTGIIFCLHQTSALLYQIKHFLKSFNLYLTPPTKRTSKVKFKDKILVYENLYLLETDSCKSLLDWKKPSV